MKIELKILIPCIASRSALQLEIAKQHPDIHLGPVYSLPVFNRSQGPIAEAEAGRKEAEARFISLQARIIGEIDESTASYNSDLKNWRQRDSRRSPVGSGKAAAIHTGPFGRRGADRLTLASARLELISAELSRLDARFAGYEWFEQSEGLCYN